MTNWSDRLRRDLFRLAIAHGENAGVDSYKSLGDSPVVLFPSRADGLAHGNFSAEAHSAIVANAAWRSRMAKSHTRRKNLPDPYNLTAKELDSSTSSDALLMNCFCYPGAVTAGLARLLNVAPDTEPEFGVPGRVALTNGRV